MRRVCLLCLTALFLCACEPSTTEESAEECSAQVSAEDVSEPSAQTSEVSCVHDFGGEPVETVGNLDVFECSLCGERKVVANGTLIGGES